MKEGSQENKPSTSTVSQLSDHSYQSSFSDRFILANILRDHCLLQCVMDIGYLRWKQILRSTGYRNELLQKI